MARRRGGKWDTLRWLTGMAVKEPDREEMIEDFTRGIEQFFYRIKNPGTHEIDGETYVVPTQEEAAVKILEAVETAADELYAWHVAFYASEQAEKLRNSRLAKWLPMLQEMYLETHGLK